VASFATGRAVLHGPPGRRLVDKDVTQTQAREVVQGVLDGITQTLVRQGRIELRNFGVFEVRKRKPRKGRNPRTGEEVKVPAKRVVTFKAGGKMEQRVGQLQRLPNGRG
jgi:nucleoid DNA-binding protein